MWDERVGLRFRLNTSLTFVFDFFPSSSILLSPSVFIFCLSLSAGTRPQATSETSSSIHTCIFFCFPMTKNKPFCHYFISNFLLALTSCPSLLLSLPWFLISMPVFSSPFLPCCSTQSIRLLRSSIFCLLCLHFIPSYVFLILFSNLFLNFHHSPSACQFAFTSPLSPSVLVGRQHFSAPI